MKKLIYLTGSIESPFFTNEISAFVNNFDEVFVIGYSGDKKKCNQISKRLNFKYAFVNTQILNPKELANLLRWMKEDYATHEYKKTTGITLKKLKMKLYIMLYCIYWMRIEKLIGNYMNDEDEYYVYSFWLSRPAFGAACLSLKYNQVKRAVSRTHRYDLYEEENALGYLPFRKLISENIDTIYFSSKDTLYYFNSKNYSNKKSPKYKLSYLGTYDHGMKIVNQNKRTIVIATCSFIIQRKRLDLIIKLIKELSILCDVTWIHIGDGENEDHIKKLAEDELVNVQYDFLGKMEDDDIFDTYKRYDVDYFVNLSDSEGVPVSIIEALSMGIPVIARDVGGIADAVDDSDGILITDKEKSIDWHSVAKDIVDLFENKEEYNRKCANARLKWSDRFDAERNPGLVAQDIILDNLNEVVLED